MATDKALTINRTSVDEIVAIARAQAEELALFIGRLESEIATARARQTQAQTVIAFCTQLAGSAQLAPVRENPARRPSNPPLRTRRGRTDRNRAGLTREDAALQLMAMRGAAVTARDCAEFFNGGGRATRNSVETTRKALVRLLADGLVVKLGPATYELAASAEPVAIQDGDKEGTEIINAA